MLAGGEGFLFNQGKSPIKTIYKKILCKLSRTQRKQLSKFILKNAPSYYLRTESQFIIEKEESASIAEELSYPTTHPGYRWYNCRWKHNILNNDIILEATNLIIDISVLIKKIYAGTASFDYEVYDNDQTDSPIKAAYLVDHHHKKHMLNTLEMTHYLDWSNISITSQ